jgi:hypothetical protein
MGVALRTGFPSEQKNTIMSGKFALIFLSILACLACDNKLPEDQILSKGETIMERIKAPKGYTWVKEAPGSFGAFLQQLELEPAGTRILDFKKKPISNQYEHVAIIKKDIGNKNLQQCADAVIRLRADYLWQKNRKDNIAFHFTNGDLYRWSDYKQGKRPVLISNSTVQFKKTASYDDSHDGFRKYLDIVFTYAGTISLNRETVKVSSNKNIKTGNILVTPGSPGHALIIVGTAVNTKGEKRYLLAQGYTPAQSIHIITNPFQGKINPWYKLDVAKSPTVTARYAFKETNIRRFKD